MSSEAAKKTDGQSVARSLRHGAIAGLGGGLVFGVVMAVIGLLPTLGQLIQQNNAISGFLLHMLVSAVVGAGFGLIMIYVAKRGTPVVIAVGILYGVLWWIIGGLILMPILLGTPQNVFVIDSTQWGNLLGHVLYGMITSLIMSALSNSNA